MGDHVELTVLSEQDDQPVTVEGSNIQDKAFKFLKTRRNYLIVVICFQIVQLSGDLNDLLEPLIFAGAEVDQFINPQFFHIIHTIQTVFFCLSSIRLLMLMTAAYLWKRYYVSMNVIFASTVLFLYLPLLMFYIPFGNYPLLTIPPEYLTSDIEPFTDAVIKYGTITLFMCVLFTQTLPSLMMIPALIAATGRMYHQFDQMKTIKVIQVIISLIGIPIVLITTAIIWQYTELKSAVQLGISFTIYLIVNMLTSSQKKLIRYPRNVLLVYVVLSCLALLADLHVGWGNFFMNILPRFILSVVVYNDVVIRIVKEIPDHRSEGMGLIRELFT
jgi:hypothetical protein